MGLIWVSCNLVAVGFVLGGLNTEPVFKWDLKTKLKVGYSGYKGPSITKNKKFRASGNQTVTVSALTKRAPYKKDIF